MRDRFKIIFFMVVCLTVFAVTDTAIAGPVAGTPAASIDLGDLPADSKSTTRVVIKNEGDARLIIGPGLKTSCGCSKPTLVKTEIMPGETAEIEVAIDAGRDENRRTVTIRCQTNDPNASWLKWTIYWQAVTPMQLKLTSSIASIPFGYSEYVLISLQMKNNGTTPCEVKSIRSDFPAGLSTAGSKNFPLVLQPNENYVFARTITPADLKIGANRINLEVELQYFGQDAFVQTTGLRLVREGTLAIKPDMLSLQLTPAERVYPFVVDGTIHETLFKPATEPSTSPITVSSFFIGAKLKTLTILEGQGFHTVAYLSLPEMTDSSDIFAGNIEWNYNGVRVRMPIDGLISPANPETSTGNATPDLITEGDFVICKNDNDIRIEKTVSKLGKYPMYVYLNRATKRVGDVHLEIARSDSPDSMPEMISFNSETENTYLYVNEPFKEGVSSLEFSAITTPLPGQNPFIAWSNNNGGRFDIDLDGDGIVDCAILVRGWSVQLPTNEQK